MALRAATCGWAGRRRSSIVIRWGFGVVALILRFHMPSLRYAALCLINRRLLHIYVSVRAIVAKRLGCGAHSVEVLPEDVVAGVKAQSLKCWCVLIGQLQRNDELISALYFALEVAFNCFDRFRAVRKVYGGRLIERADERKDSIYHAEDCVVISYRFRCGDPGK